MNETCASCEQDCGPCSVCGNHVCEPPYETCANCETDCGACPTGQTCTETLGCVFQCFMGGAPPTLSCPGLCVAEACPKAQYFADQVVQCAFMYIGQCFGMGGGGVLNCLMQHCGQQIATCIGSPC
jgi:hypothetical protein